MEVEKEMRAVIDLVTEVGTEYGISVLGAIAILIIGWMIAGWVRSAVYKGLSRLPRTDDTLRPFLANLVRWTILAFVIVAVLNQFGVQTTSIIAVLGAAGLAIGLALQGTLANVAAGVMLLMLRPFQVGDFIDAGGLSGTVMEIGLFTSELKTADGVYIMAPNSRLWNQPITNFSRNKTRRVDLDVGISYGDDIAGARAVLMEVMKADDRVLADPEPQTMVMTLGDSSVNIRMRCWTNVDVFWPAQFDMREKAKVEIEKAGFTIPFPQRDVHVIQEASSTPTA